MKAKLITSYFLGFLYLIPIVLAFFVDTFWLYDHKFYSFFYLIFTFVWISLAVLMGIEHERHLIQVWYCHRFFWITNCFFVVVFTLISFILQIYNKNDYVAYSFSSIEVIFSLITVGYMMKTKSFRLKKLQEINTPPSRSSETLIPKHSYEGCIDIVLEYKITKKNDIHFRLSAGKVHKRVKKSLKEFLK